MTPEQIANKYVHGMHDALTDNQEIKDMITDIETYAKEYHEAKLKLLGIGGVSKSFAVGENVKVKCCIHGHEFENGQIVTIVEHDPSQTTSWLCSDGRNQWWLNEEEANVC